MTLYPAFKANPPPNLRVSLLGGETLREVGKLDADGKALLSIRHHVDTGRWQVILPYEMGGAYLPIVGSAGNIRAAYREAYRQHRLLRREPARMARGRATALRAFWMWRQRARRYANTVNAMTTTETALRELHAGQARIIHELQRENTRLTAVSNGRDGYEHSLVKQLTCAKERADKFERNFYDLKLAHNRLKHEVDYWRRRNNLPTSDDLKVVGSKPVYPLRSQSQPEPETLETTAIRIHAALLPPGVTLEAVVAAIEVLPAPAPAETGA